MFGSSEFMPHGTCYLWRPGLVGLHVASDVMIGLAYMAIPIALVSILRRRRDLPFDWMIWCFGVFIVACGATHWLAVWNVWHADYWLSGAVKALTALASVPTALLLIRLVPTIVSLPSPGQLADANRALTAANAELQAFSYSVAHDLRGPLRAMSGFGAALEEDCGHLLNAEGAEHLRRIRGEARRMGELVDGLLGLAQLNRVSLANAAVDLQPIAERVVEELRAADPAREVAVEIEAGLRVSGDARLLELLLLNLLSNAWKFTRPKEHARIRFGRAQDADGRDVLFVRDNGVGFDMAHAAKLFGAFQRLHKEAEFPGTGIGLATVRRIVERHGGSVWAEAKPGDGATFFFSLPKAPGPPSAER